MAERYFVLNQGTLVLEVWKGTFTFDDILAQQKRKLNDPRVDASATILVDLRLAQMPVVSADKVASVVDIHQKPCNNTRIARSVVVVPDAEMFKPALEYQKQAQTVGMDSVVLSTMQSACTLLRLSLADIEQLIATVPAD